MNRHISVLAVAVATLVFPAVATHATPSPSVKPSPSPSLRPTPSTTPLPQYYCASSMTGIPEKMPGNHCGKGKFLLGAGAIVKGKNRPSQLHPLLKNRLRAAQLAASAKGFSIGVTSGWRSLKDQQRIYKNAIKTYNQNANRWALPPEKSMHPWGLALDLHFGSQAGATWFKRNSSTFGLCRVYKNEWWHFEPIIAPGARCPRLKVNAS